MRVGVAVAVARLVTMAVAVFMTMARRVVMVVLVFMLMSVFVMFGIIRDVNIELGAGDIGLLSA